ncbi:MAG: hypothetical protein ACREE9_17190 [Stellaceae bacterium]
MQRVAIERAGADRPALLDAHAGAGGRSLLLGAQGSMPGNRHDVRDRRAVAGDQFLAGLNLADAPRKSLVGLAQRAGPAHLLWLNAFPVEMQRTGVLPGSARLHFVPVVRLLPCAREMRWRKLRATIKEQTGDR